MVTDVHGFKGFDGPQKVPVETLGAMGVYQSREFRLETRAGEFMSVASLRGSLLASEGKPTARSRRTNASFENLAPARGQRSRGSRATARGEVAIACSHEHKTRNRTI